MRLSDLAGKALMEHSGANGAVDISGITADSRKVGPGFLFAALDGSVTDGARFVPEAERRGAVAVLAGRPVAAGIPVLVSPDPRRCLARMAARFHGAQPGTVVAVTGTAGKSSVASFLRQIRQATGAKAASIGTLGVEGPDGLIAGSLTTPDPVELHRTMAALAAGGIDFLSLEASSHGLDQRRLDGVRLAGGIFTNLGHDHLDYHHDADSYLAAKMRLFRDLLPAGAPAVINLDDARADAVIAAASGEGLSVTTYGRADGDRTGATTPDLTWRIDAASAEGQDVTFGWQGARATVRLNLVGAFQVENVAAAMALCLKLGTAFDACLAALPSLEGAPGRLQRAGSKGGAAAFIDYAHKPEALRAVLQTLRPLTAGRLIVVFGCGGDRDRAKRPMMGIIAADLADIAIVTDDNPRGEDPAAIRAEIMAACPDATEIGDRRAAIRHAAGLLRDGDILVVAGKGHETGQKVGDTVLPFDDMVETRSALADIARGEVRS